MPVTRLGGAAAPALLLALAGCDDAGPSDVLVLTVCPDDAPCELVGDGASVIGISACIPDTVVHPWRLGEAGAPDLKLSIALSGGAWADGEELYEATLSNQQTCVTPELVVSTGETVHLEASFLGVVAEETIALAPAVVDAVSLTTSVPYFEPAAITQLVVTAAVRAPGGATVSDGTLVTFAATPEPASTSYTLSPASAYVTNGTATTTLVLLPGATHVTLAASAAPPDWGGDTPAATEGSLVVYAKP